MWLLLTVASLISALGTTHGFLGHLNPENPEATMNVPTPRQYHLTDMNVSIAVWNGSNVWLADPQDVDLWLSKLPNLIYHKKIPYYNHLDFIWAVDAPQEVYSEIVSMMEKYNN